MLPPELTIEQKRRFEQGFREIMAAAPQELQELWDGKINWYPSKKPLIKPEIISGLKADLLFRFGDLCMAMFDRTI